MSYVCITLNIAQTHCIANGQMLNFMFISELGMVVFCRHQDTSLDHKLCVEAWVTCIWVFVHPPTGHIIVHNMFLRKHKYTYTWSQMNIHIHDSTHSLSHTALQGHAFTVSVLFLHFTYVHKRVQTVNVYKAIYCV